MTTDRDDTRRTQETTSSDRTGAGRDGAETDGEVAAGSQSWRDGTGGATERTAPDGTAERTAPDGGWSGASAGDEAPAADREETAVLLVEDNPGDATLIDRHLKTASGKGSILARPVLTHVESLSAATDRLAGGEFDVVLLDLGLPESNGLESLERLQERFEAPEGPDPVAVVVLTGLNDAEVAVRAIQRGAQDYLVKRNIDETVLERSLRYAIERHRQERELQRQNERLDQFADVVSHDLRNPLAIALGHVEMARETGSESTLATAQDALERMDDLVDNLLHLAREGESVEDPVPVDLGAIARNCWETVDTAAMDLDVEADGTVLADEGRLRQLFENLYRNAREHAGDDVTVWVQDLPDSAGFAVEDDGPGIHPDRRESVFDPGETTREDGTGFGLNIVREIARAHDWSVAVTEGSASGARFEVRGVEYL